MNSSVFSVRKAKVDICHPYLHESFSIFCAECKSRSFSSHILMNWIFFSIFNAESKSICFLSFFFTKCSVFSVRSAKVDVFHPLSLWFLQYFLCAKQIFRCFSSIIFNSYSSRTRRIWADIYSQRGRRPSWLLSAHIRQVREE